MFSYYIRIWDKYRKPVLSLAIVTRKQPPPSEGNHYELKAFGTELRYTYNVFYIRELDYHACLASQNCVEVALGILAQFRRIPRWKKKIEVIKNLMRLGLNPDEIHLLISFVDRLLPLKPEELAQFEKHTIEEEKEIKMILTSYEEKALERGLVQGKAQGIKQGKAKGIKQGITQGIEQAKLDDLIKILRIKFGPIPITVSRRLKKIHEIEKLDQLIQLAIQVDKLEKIVSEINQDSKNKRDRKNESNHDNESGRLV